MAQAYRTLEELGRKAGGKLIVKCSCGHEARFAVTEIAAWFRLKRWDDYLRTVGQRFRCDRCGKRGAATSWEPWAPPPPPPSVPKPVETK